MLSDDLKLLVGLGNPGAEYYKTRHNVGFMVLEEIARKNNCSFREAKNYLVELVNMAQVQKKQDF